MNRPAGKPCALAQIARGLAGRRGNDCLQRSAAKYVDQGSLAAAGAAEDQADAVTFRHQNRLLLLCVERNIPVHHRGRMFNRSCMVICQNFSKFL